MCFLTYDVELCNAMSDATAVACDASVRSCVGSSDIADDQRTIGHLLKSEKAKDRKERENVINWRSRRVKSLRITG